MLSKIGRSFLVGFFRRDAFVAISTASYVPMLTHRGFCVDAMPLQSVCQLTD